MAGLPVTERANTSTKSERQANAFLKEEYMAVMIVLRKDGDKRETYYECDLEENFGGLYI